MDKNFEKNDFTASSGKSCPACEKHKNTPRGEETIRQLQSRLNRIIGQLNGTKNMLDDNRYCGDILVQLSAAQSALKSVAQIILKEHMKTCVVEEIQKGNTDVIDEAVDLIDRMK